MDVLLAQMMDQTTWETLTGLVEAAMLASPSVDQTRPQELQNTSDYNLEAAARSYASPKSRLYTHERGLASHRPWLRCAYKDASHSKGSLACAYGPEC
jgi:hypothetical protein